MSKQSYYQKTTSKSKTNSLEYELTDIKSDYRIITKNLVYIIGLSESLADKKKLEKNEYLGQYGKILKIVINKKKYHISNKFGPTYSAYITYNEPYEASIAILSLDNIIIDNHIIRASFGTTKYCQFYLKKLKCNNKDCFFLHKKANPEDIIFKNELNSNNSFFYNQQIFAIKLADIYNPAVKKKLLLNKDLNSVFPTPDLIYENEVVIENMPKVKKIIKKNLSVSKKDDKKDEKSEKQLINIIEKQRFNDDKFKELESSNSTLTNSHCLTTSISSKSFEINSQNYNNSNNKKNDNNNDNNIKVVDNKNDNNNNRNNNKKDNNNNNSNNKNNKNENNNSNNNKKDNNNKSNINNKNDNNKSNINNKNDNNNSNNNKNDNNNNNKNYNNNLSFFTIREKSRFDFVKNDINEKNENNEIPDFVCKINNLAFKINMLLSQSDRIGQENKFVYFDELNNIKNNENEQKWRKFLFDNLKEN